MPLPLILAACALSAYEFFSLIAPLELSLTYKLASAAALLLVAFQGAILQKIGGGMFFAPELPQAVLFVVSWLYNTFFLLLFMLAAKDIAWLLWKFLAHGRPFPRAAASIAILSAALLISLYGTWNAVRVPNVRTEEVVLDRLPRQLDGMNVVLLADLHISALNRAPLIEAIVQKTNALSPDVILLNGDMVDGTVANREADVEPLRKLRAGRGVYGSTGNHEYYSGYGEWADKFRELGIKMLDNAHKAISADGGQIVIAGVVDQMGARFGSGGPNVTLALNGSPKDAPVVLMAHRPEAARENAERGVDLQLSGHTHGGMVTGFDRFIARFNSGYVRGWYRVGGMKLYVSPGTLLWNGFALRLGVPSEITQFILRSGK
ncbi:MAG: metallophosphoesterase [Synergistaceae bacterium]|nr:metallophosphoesterase [Synergistaceae bacterium]